MSEVAAGPAPLPVQPPPAAQPPAKLDEMMLAMDVVDTLRHREVLVERELNEDQREAQLIARLRQLYKSQGIEVTDDVLQQGVRALAESRFVYTPPPPSSGRTLATFWVRRGRYGGILLGLLLAIGVGFGAYNIAVVGPQREAARAGAVELGETLPRQLAAAYQAVVAEAQVDAARQRADAVRAQGQSALQRGNVADARAAVGELDALATALRQEYTLRIAGRPSEQTGFVRSSNLGPGRSLYIVVNAVDARGNPVNVPVRNIETNAMETVSRFAVAVPPSTYDAVRADKGRNGLVQNDRLAEKRRGYLEPEFRMSVLEGRLTNWSER